MNPKTLDPIRSDFLAEPDVASFVKFFREYLHSKEFHHSYYHYDSRSNWHCESLASAAANYKWPISEVFRNTLQLPGNQPMPEDLQSNAIVLNDLQRRLRQAYCAGDASQLQGVGNEIFAWGGTLKGNPARLKSLNAKNGGLKAYLTFCYIAFGAGEALNPGVFRKRELLCNAGFTKIYSLQFSNFVIYDSRVAAALSLFVLLYCVSHGKRLVPKSLQFPCMPAKSYERKKREPRIPLRRNPSATAATGDRWEFPNCNSNHARHIHANVRANWLLDAAISDDPNPNENRFIGMCGVTALRALEAALFMIGYDLENAVLPPGVSWL